MVECVSDGKSSFSARVSAKTSHVTDLESIGSSEGILHGDIDTT